MNMAVPGDHPAYSIWAEQPRSLQTVTGDEMVLMLRPAENVHVATPPNTLHSKAN